jgi:hypothetical protein
VAGVASGAANPVAQVRDVRGRQLADQVELDMLGRQVVEQPPPLSEEDGYDVQLQFVELPGAE